MLKTDTKATSDHSFNHNALNTENMYLFMERCSFWKSCDFQQFPNWKEKYENIFSAPEIEEPFTCTISNECSSSAELRSVHGFLFELFQVV